MSNKEVEQEIRDCFSRMGVDLASPQIFGSNKWIANSQYGYQLSEHTTRTEAERAAIEYYAERMNLIRQ